MDFSKSSFRVQTLTGPPNYNPLDVPKSTPSAANMTTTFRVMNRTILITIVPISGLAYVHSYLQFEPMFDPDVALHMVSGRPRLLR